MATAEFTVPIIEGDLIEADADVIAQQCNCLTVRPHGLSMYIKENMGVDPYGKRKKLGNRRNLAVEEDRSKIGSIVLYGKKNRRPRYVACMYAQFAPGKPHSYYQDICQQHVDPVTNEVIDDSKTNREMWFGRCLEKLERQMIKLECNKIAFPYQIGCGLAGGSWPTYKDMITCWAQKNADNFSVFFVHKKHS